MISKKNEDRSQAAKRIQLNIKNVRKYFLTEAKNKGTIQGSPYVYKWREENSREGGLKTKREMIIDKTRA